LLLMLSWLLLAITYSRMSLAVATPINESQSDLSEYDVPNPLLSDELDEDDNEELVDFYRSPSQQQQQEGIASFFPGVPHGYNRKRNPGLYSFGLGKRQSQRAVRNDATTAQNRFSFGLGKRDGGDTQRFGFGLGKRDGGDTQRFSFGLGKRDGGDAQRFGFGLGKRDGGDTQRFGFGLGKRDGVDTQRFGFGLGKRDGGDTQRFGFGLGKRDGVDTQRFGFGLGKRDGGDTQRFGFGLGKRSDAHRFGFGLGKRNGGGEQAEPTKRNAQKPRFKFGLGKRSAADDIDADETPSLSELVDYAVEQGSSDYDAEEKRSSAVMFPPVAPAGYYSAYRHPYQDYSPTSAWTLSDNRPFFEFRKRFMAGKNLPVYNFGLGK